MKLKKNLIVYKLSKKKKSLRQGETRSERGKQKDTQFCDKTMLNIKYNLNSPQKFHLFDVYYNVTAKIGNRLAEHLVLRSTQNKHYFMRKQRGEGAQNDAKDERNVAFRDQEKTPPNLHKDLQSRSISTNKHQTRERTLKLRFLVQKRVAFTHKD